MECSVGDERWHLINRRQIRKHVVSKNLIRFRTVSIFTRPKLTLDSVGPSLCTCCDKSLVHRTPVGEQPVPRAAKEKFRIHLNII